MWCEYQFGESEINDIVFEKNKAILFRAMNLLGAKKVSIAFTGKFGFFEAFAGCRMEGLDVEQIKTTVPWLIQNLDQQTNDCAYRLHDISVGDALKLLADDTMRRYGHEDLLFPLGVEAKATFQVGRRRLTLKLSEKTDTGKTKRRTCVS